MGRKTYLCKFIFTNMRATKQHFLRILFALILSLWGGLAVADSLNEEFYYDGYFYRIISLSPRRVALIAPPQGVTLTYPSIVQLPDTALNGSTPYLVYSIADSTFFNNTTLTKVELPASLRYIGLNVFSGTSSLDTLRCYSEIPPQMYFDSINSKTSMGNLSPGPDYNRLCNHIILRAPCAGIDNYSRAQGWSLFRHYSGENIYMIYRDTICQGDSYADHQFYLIRPSSGIYELANISGGQTGCTYDAELRLVVHPVYENVFSYYYCDGSSLTYHAHGFDIDNWTSGEHTWVHQNLSVHGCDSVSRLHFRQMTSSLNFYDSVCVGSSYSHTFNGIFRFDLPSFETAVPGVDLVIDKYFRPVSDATTDYQTNCEQTVTLNLHVNPLTTDTIVVNSCEGYPYTWQRSGYNAIRVPITHTDTYPATGFYSDTLFAHNGCMMFKHLDLHIWPPSDTVLYDTLCGNQTLLFGTSRISTQGVHTAQYANQHFCDSTVALHLTLRDSYTEQQPTYTQVPIYHSGFDRAEDRFAWSYANEGNGWRIKDGYLRVSTSDANNNYNLNQQSDSYALFTFHTGDYDSIKVEMPIIVGGEAYNDYLKVFLPGSTTSNYYFNTNSTYSQKYKNVRPHNPVKASRRGIRDIAEITAICKIFVLFHLE